MANTIEMDTDSPYTDNLLVNLIRNAEVLAQRAERCQISILTSTLKECSHGSIYST